MLINIQLPQDALSKITQEITTMSDQLNAKIDQLTSKASSLEQRAIAAEQRDLARSQSLAGLQQTIQQNAADLKALKDQLSTQVPANTTVQENSVQAVIDELTNVSNQIDHLAADQAAPAAQTAPAPVTGAPASPEAPATPDQPSSPGA